MNVFYNAEKLGRIFEDFYQMTGVNVNLVDTNFSFLDCNPQRHNDYCGCVQCTEAGRVACMESDIYLLEQCQQTKKSVWHICHAGLLDIAVPLFYQEEVLGYLILGQIKEQDTFLADRDYLTQMGCNLAKMEQYHKELPTTSPEKIQSLISLVTMLSEYILLENMLTLSVNPGLKTAVEYIHRHLEENLDIHSISKHTRLSKSALYQNFHKHFHCTINAYINQKRVEKAKALLSLTDFSMEEISQQVGFSSASYFGRIFKNITGLSPRNYRKKKDL